MRLVSPVWCGGHNFQSRHSTSHTPLATTNPLPPPPPPPPPPSSPLWQVARQMFAHCQQAFSGDMTLEAARRAIQEVVAEEADDYFVVLLSDANLDQYNISAEDLSGLINADPRVHVFILFIGTLGDQAEKYMDEMPPGHVFLCLDTKQIPKVLQQVFTSALM
jgi:hypothetical protein